MKKLTTQKSNYITDRLMELMGTEVGKEYTDELLIAMLCIQINELEGKLATERETTKTGSICDHCATVVCGYTSGVAEPLDVAIEALKQMENKNKNNYTENNCLGCKHFDEEHTNRICYDCKRAYKDMYQE